MCTRINYKIVPVTNLNKYLNVVQVEMNNMYINTGANNGSEKLRKKKYDYTHTHKCVCLCVSECAISPRTMKSFIMKRIPPLEYS